MARPTTRPRLAQLDPAALAADVDSRLARYLGRLVTPLAPGFAVDVQRHGPSGVALSVDALTRYAQGGLPVWDWETHEEPRDALQELLAVLYGRPADALDRSDVGPLDESNDSEQLDGADLDDPLALVLVAAWARVLLAEESPLSARQLGALGGLDPRAVQRLARDGELRLEGSPLAASPDEARRWLGSRGVKGL